MTRAAFILFLVAVVLSIGCAMASDGYVVKGKHIREIFEDRSLQRLSAAAARGDLVAIRQLIEGGINPNVEGKEDVTPLIWAFIAESEIGMETLIRAGADPNFKLSDGSSALSLAMDSVNAAWLRFFLERGGDPNARDHNGMPLIVRAVGGFLPGAEHLRVLLEHGADLEQRSRAGQTALLYAVMKSRFDLAYILIDAGADIWASVTRGNSSITVATWVGSSRIIRGTDQERALQREWRAKVEERLRDAGMEIHYTEKYL